MKLSTILKRLLTLIKGYRTWFLFACLFALVSVIINLCTPLMVGDIIDGIGSQGEENALYLQLFYLAIFYLLFSITSWGLMLCTNKIAYASSYTLRKCLYEKLEKLSIAFYDTHEHGDLMSRYTNDIDMISDGLLQGLSTLLSGITTIVFAIIFMCNINLMMTGIVLLCAPFTYLVARTITRKTQKFFVAQSVDLGQVNAYTQELFQGIKTVKTYGQEQASCEAFAKRNQTLYASGRQAQFYGSLANPSTRLVTNTAYTIVGVSGSILCMLQLLSIGNLSSFLLYSNVFSKPFNEISSVMTQIQSAIASAQRVFSVFDEAEEREDQEPTYETTHGDITFSHVAFRYQPSTPLINDLNVSIPYGTRVAIVGKTGAGKTTLVNLLMRFYEIQAGEIQIDGINIQSMHRDTLRSYFGMVLQDTYLFEDTIHNIIAYGKQDASREDVILAAKLSGADSFITQLKDGYDTFLDGTNAHLSQGQRQLLSITRVILMDPKILILDEATSNIDTRSEQHVQKAMELLMQGRTSFVIAHRLSTIMDSDLILVMDHGDIVEQGTHADLLQKNGAYASLYQAQFVAS